MTLTADHVARAIIAACREVPDSDPLQVAQGSRVKKTQPNAHARSYAALALGDLFGSDEIVGRVCGASDSYVSVNRWQLKRGTLRWFDRRAFKRVKEAVGLLPEPKVEDPVQAPKPATPSAPPKPGPMPGRPFASASQRAAYEELERAVRNTAALPKGT